MVELANGLNGDHVAFIVVKMDTVKGIGIAMTPGPSLVEKTAQNLRGLKKRSATGKANVQSIVYGRIGGNGVIVTKPATHQPMMIKAFGKRVPNIEKVT